MFRVHRLIISIVVLLGFFPFLWLFDGDDLFTMLDALAVSVGAGVIIAYAPAYFRWLTAYRTTAGYLLAIGILITWFALVIRLGWLWSWRLAGRPIEFFDHPMVAFTIYCAAVGAGLHLLANSAIRVDEGEDRIPIFGWGILAAAIVVGLTSGLVLIYLAK